MDGVTLVNCKLVNTDLAFEYSSVNADICSSVLSVKNPREGVISAESIGEIILDESYIDTTKVSITEREKSDED